MALTDIKECARQRGSDAWAHDQRRERTHGEYTDESAALDAVGNIDQPAFQRAWQLQFIETEHR